MAETAVLGASTTGNPTPTTTTSSSAYEADERIAARHAVTLAEEKWRSLCTQHASTFVAAERRSVAIQKILSQLLNEIDCETKPSVKRVSRALDPTYDNSKDDYDDGEDEDDEEPIQPASALLADLADKHRLRRRTLMQHSSLLELLELPSLMDACVRSSLYEDALSIAGFANTLERRHLLETQQNEKKGDEKQQTNGGEKSENKGDVVAGVVSEIRRREADLRRMLIHRLRQDVTMPQCLEVVTALRRLNGVELERRNNSKSLSGGASSATAKDYDLEGVHAAMEMRLQVDFLEARDAWLEGGVTKVGSAQAAAASSDSKGSSSSSGTSAQAEQILDGIERYRTRCFEIVTQFLAIFRGSFAPSTASSSNNNDHSFSLLSMWTARRIQTFLTTLSSNMVTHVNDTATLRDALDAASFFASSMGRVGADFQPLLAPIFEPRLVEMVVGQWNDGLNGMIETLKACRDAGVSGPLFGAETSNNNENGDGNNADGMDVMQSSRTPAPPRKSLALPALARFLNTYLSGLNELRRCLLPGAFPAIRSAQAKLVADVKLALQQNERSALTPGLRGEASKLREIASKMKSEFDHCLEPYMTQTLEVALGSVDYAVEVTKKAAAESAEKARIAAEKKRLEMERIEKEKQEREKRERIAEEKARKEAEEKARKEAEEKAAAKRSAIETHAEPAQIESDNFDDGDMYGSDSD